MDKRCSKCEKVKPLDEFHRNKNHRDGHHEYCKECRKKEAAMHYQENSERIGDRVKIYRKNNKQSVFERMKRYTQEHREQTAAASKRYRETEKGKQNMINASERLRNNHPEKIRAHSTVGYAVASGKIPRANTLICSVCNKKQADHYHHYLGYERKHWLDVIPVCTVCHVEVEGK